MYYNPLFLVYNFSQKSLFYFLNKAGKGTSSILSSVKLPGLQSSHLWLWSSATVGGTCRLLSTAFCIPPAAARRFFYHMRWKQVHWTLIGTQYTQIRPPSILPAHLLSSVGLGDCMSGGGDWKRKSSYRDWASRVQWRSSCHGSRPYVGRVVTGDTQRKEAGYTQRDETCKWMTLILPCI